MVGQMSCTLHGGTTLADGMFKRVRVANGRQDPHFLLIYILQRQVGFRVFQQADGCVVAG